MPNVSQILDSWDWEEFIDTTFTVIVVVILGASVLTAISAAVYITWTAGYGGLVIGFVGLVIIALIIAAIVQIVNFRNRGW